MKVLWFLNRSQLCGIASKLHLAAVIFLFGQIYGHSTRGGCRHRSGDTSNVAPQKAACRFQSTPDSEVGRDPTHVTGEIQRRNLPVCANLVEPIEKFLQSAMNMPLYSFKIKAFRPSRTLCKSTITSGSRFLLQIVKNNIK